MYVYCIIVLFVSSENIDIYFYVTLKDVKWTHWHLVELQISSYVEMNAIDLTQSFLQALDTLLQLYDMRWFYILPFLCHSSLS